MRTRKTITHILWHQRRRELITAAIVDLLTLAAIGALVLACAGMARGDCVIAFWSPACAPCLQQKPIEEKLAGEGVGMRFVNVQEQPELAAAYRVRRIPCVVYVAETPTGNYDCGRLVGLRTEAELRWFVQRRVLFYDAAPVANLVRSVLGMPILVTPY